MGSTCTHRPKGISHKEFFSGEWDGEDRRLLDIAGGLNVLYGAYEIDEPHEVHAVVVLISWRDEEFNFCWKEMSESMHPYYYDCPDRILALLTEPTTDDAREWRERALSTQAHRHKAAKVKKGDIVRFSTSLQFTDGTEEDTLEFLRRNTFVVPGHSLGFRRYRIAGWRKRGFEVIAHA